VDDNEVFDAISSSFLYQLPECAVLKAANGMQAIETGNHARDLILNDLNMPVVMDIS
jgi:CheY-like chemotaxis protein